MTQYKDIIKQIEHVKEILGHDTTTSKEFICLLQAHLLELKIIKYNIELEEANK